MTDDERKGFFEAMRQEIASAHVETRRQFQVAVEAFDHKVEVLAETVIERLESSTH